MHYYAFNIADYRKDADWLSVSEAGIYRWLIDQYYLDERPIENDLRLLMRRLHLTSDQKELLTSVLEAFFVLEDEAWRHERIDEEIEQYHAKIEQARQAGMASGKARKRKRTTVKRPLDSRSTEGQPTINQEPLTNNQKDTTTSKPAASTSGNGQVPIKAIVEKWNVFAEANNLPQVAKLTTTIKGQIRQRWNDIPSLEKWDNFFSHISANDFLAGRTPPGMGRSKPFRSTLLWITKETNFNKIASGEYD